MLVTDNGTTVTQAAAAAPSATIPRDGVLLHGTQGGLADATGRSVGR
jgi:hypothetical protein